MSEIAKVTPAAPLITRVPRDHPLPDGPGHQPNQDDAQHENSESNDTDSEQRNEQHDGEGGIDLYV